MVNPADFLEMRTSHCQPVHEDNYYGFLVTVGESECLASS